MLSVWMDEEGASGDGLGQAVGEILRVAGECLSRRSSEGKKEEKTEERWADIPAVVMYKITSLLHFPELVITQSVCRSWSQSSSSSLRRWNAFAARASVYQWEPVRYALSSYFSGMSPREAAAASFHRSTGLMYMFGGKSVGREEKAAEFNDLWSFDLVTSTWSRILVRSSPFPVPKSASTLVPWKKFLVLYGGVRQVPRENPLLAVPSEIHLFDVEKKEWQQLTPLSPADPTQSAGAFDHAAVVWQDYMIVVGGSTGLNANRLVRYFDLVRHVWHIAPLDLSVPGEAPSGSQELASGSLVVLESGKLLYLPQYPDQDPSHSLPPTRAYVLHFDPLDLSQQWRWKAYPMKLRHFHRKPIVLWGQAATIELDGQTKIVRLASLACPTTRSSSASSTSSTSSLAAPQSFTAASIERTGARVWACRESVEMRMQTLNNDAISFYDSLPLRFNADGLDIGIHQGETGRLGDYDVRVSCNGSNGWTKAEEELVGNFVKALLPTETRMESGTSRTSSPSPSPSPSLHSPAPHQPPGVRVCEEIRRLRRSTMRRKMVVLQADPSDLENQGELVWTEAETRLEGPPATNRFSFVSARGTLILHGGSFPNMDELSSGDSAIGGGTYILHPER